MHMNSQAAGKKWSLNNSLLSISESKLASSKKLESSRFPQSIHAPKSSQTAVKSGIQQLNQSDICHNNDDQLEMAIADFWQRNYSASSCRLN